MDADHLFHLLSSLPGCFPLETSIFQNVSLNSARKLPKFLLKIVIQGWGRLEKMAQWLREVTAFAKDLDSLTTDSNHLQLQFQGI